MLPRLVVMVKEPKAGRVKTRLGREIGTVAATSFYRHAATAVLRRLTCITRWQTWLAVAPETSVASSFWPAGIPRRAQGHGDLGQRMQRIMDWPGRGPIIIIGTDIPAIRPCHIAAALKALGGSDAVMGPTPDGGYWLVGFKRSPAILKPFTRVRWSSEHALADTLTNLAGARMSFAASLADVDDAAGWREVRAWSGRVIVPPASRS
jgi:rSAM/selenodomain-associated transferase 1